jgi:hypothetical protein
MSLDGAIFLGEADQGSSIKAGVTGCGLSGRNKHDENGRASFAEQNSNEKTVLPGFEWVPPTCCG